MNNENSNKPQQISFDDDDIDIKEVFVVLWKNKKIIILMTAIFAVGSILIALNLTNYYKSEVILSVDEGVNAKDSLGAGARGLASLGGLSLGSNVGSKASIAIETIQSRAFLKHLITFDNVLPSIMAPKSFDSESKKILFDQKLYNENNGEWLRNASGNQQSKPSYLETHEIYMKQLSISQSKKTNLITISIEHLSPIFAKELLSLIVGEVNELLRNKDLRESSDAIAFLNSEMPKASLISMKDAINQLVQSQLETQMMAKINTEYILKVIEPPFEPERKSKPSRSMIVILGTFAGGIFAIMWVMIRQYAFGDLESDSDS